MKAITLHQPWASLIAMGVKRYETRAWAPSFDLVGERFAIHAGMAAVNIDHLDRDVVMALISATDPEDKMSHEEWENSFPRGVVLCTATLTGIYRISRIDDMNNLAHVHAVGKSPLRPEGIPMDHYGFYSATRVLWDFTDIQPISPPVKAKGKMGLWEWSHDEERV